MTRPAPLIAQVEQRIATYEALLADERTEQPGERAALVCAWWAARDGLKMLRRKSPTHQSALLSNHERAKELDLKSA
ncbi:MAG: hypothetical protein NVSMB20_05340 [Bradyrhizobium sp.]